MTSAHRGQVLITTDELRTRLEGPSGRRPILLDVRWGIGAPSRRPDYLRGHLPGAVWVDLERHLTGAHVTGAGRHPLPDPRALQDAARGWGVHTGDEVVVYDDQGGLSAARAWWVLRWAGLERVRLLDGGLPAWETTGLPLSDAEPDPEQGDVVVRTGGMPTLTAEAAEAMARDGVLVDARAAARYRGDEEPIDPIAGHVPGAVNVPTTAHVQADGRLVGADELLTAMRAAGVRAGEPVGAYCGSGVTAAHTVLALASVGIPAALYPGSWSGWIEAADHPVATGPDPLGRRG